jgi:hypothetical protein
MMKLLLAFLEVHGSSPVVNRNAFNLVAQVPVEVTDKGIHHLPLVILGLGVYLRYQ